MTNVSVTRKNISPESFFEDIERIVFSLYAEGFETKEICMKLNLSEYKIRKINRTVIEKTGTSNKVQAIVKLIQGNIID